MKRNTLLIINNKVLICAILVIICCNLGCREPGPEYTDILLYNESDEVIYACGSSCLDDKLTPEMALLSTGEVSGLMLIPHHSSSAIIDYYFGNNNNQILIFKESTIKQYTTEELINNNIYDKYYNLSSYELESMGYKIVYTGD